MYNRSILTFRMPLMLKLHGRLLWILKMHLSKSIHLSKISKHFSLHEKNKILKVILNIFIWETFMFSVRKMQKSYKIEKLILSRIYDFFVSQHNKKKIFFFFLENVNTLLRKLYTLFRTRSHFVLVLENTCWLRIFNYL